MAGERAWLGDLLTSVASAPPEMAVSVLAQLLARRLAATEVSFLITDHGGKAVVRLTGAHAEGGPEHPRPIQLRGSVYEQVVRSQQVHVASGEREGEGGPDPIQVIAPVSDRGDAIGLLELTVPVRPDRQTMQLIVEATYALAYVVITNRRFTDLYEWGRRTTRLSLAAEIQHRLLPDSFTCETGRFIVAGALEPAADIGGDTFDYTLDRHALHLSLTDAMGHDVQAALVATMVVGALRNARRAGGSLLDQAQDAHQAVADYADRAHQAFADQSERVREAIIRHGGQVMATGQLLRVSLDTGQTTFVNAGHVWPLRLRDGRVEEITPLADLPFGVTPNPGYRLQNLDLRQGDRLILFTDGMVEPHGTEADLSDLVRQTSDWHPRDAVRLFTETVLEVSNHNPRDDATVLCLDWPAPDSPYIGHR
ncbi:serine/threonine-protein phosphatase [Streptomyces sp. NBC_00638]|uniref:PP2C family protein-serine/threonine phosphatase n=1 Tax=Streptomyces sp. NBC_00638 TaxID=2975794 RepID=UPI00225001C1|nr:PP2C family protein-serine/threonine phosphatase [Streptomyces sp. NBC_00638]MCX5008435.1 serine/threonine-protein phosphatase [Streptomyces sp. NBC_00638]